MDSFSFASHSFLYPNYDSSFIVADWCYSSLVKVKKALVYLSKSQQEAQIKPVQAKVIHPHKSSQWRKDDFLLDHPNGLWSTPEKYNRYLDIPNQFYPLGSIKEENVKTAEVIFIQSGYNIDEIDIAGFPPNKLLKPALCDTDLYWRIEETSDLKKWKLVQLLASWICGGKQNMAKLNCLMRLPGEDCDYERFHYETYQLDHIYESLKQSVKKEIYERFKNDVYDEFEDLSTPTINTKSPAINTITPLLLSAQDLIHKHFGLRYNKLDHKIYDKNGKVFTKFNRLYLMMEKVDKNKWSKERTIDLAVLSAEEHSYDPLQDQFNGWAKRVKSGDYDKELDINTLATRFLNPDATEFENIAFRTWLIGAVERIRNPGCQMDIVMVLHGPQGVGKTTTLRIIGGDFFAEDVTLSRDRNMVLKRLGHHILELSEMNHSMLSSDSIKTVISNTKEHYRKLYENATDEPPRRCVFAGTTNNQYFLNDPTGNRRFAIIEVTDHAIKNSEELKRKRDDIFCAVLAAILKDKLKPVIPNKYLAMQNEINESYTTDINDVYEEKITKYLYGAFPNDSSAYIKKTEEQQEKEPLTMLKIWVDGMEGEPLNMGRKHKDEISHVMKKLGYEYIRIRVNSVRIRFWKKK